MVDVLRVEPKVEVDERFKLEVLNSLKARYEQERVGIQATDLLLSRQAVFFALGA
jgi:hypothetical protein